MRATERKLIIVAGLNWIQKAAAAHKDTTGFYYSYVQVSCRHLKGDRAVSLAGPQYLVGL